MFLAYILIAISAAIGVYHTVAIAKLRARIEKLEGR